MTSLEPLRVEMKFATGFLIGTGLGVAGVLDNTVRKDSRGLPCIPGETIKGIVRDATKEIVLILGYPYYERAVDELADLVKTGKDPQLHSNFSPITRIFGSSILPGEPLFEFRAAYMPPADREMWDFLQRSVTWGEAHTRIHYETRTAFKGSLHAYEVALPANDRCGLPQYRFAVEIIPTMPIREEDEYLIGLLFCGLRFADRIGGKKSRGKGVVELIPPQEYPDSHGKSLKLTEWIDKAFDHSER